MSVNNAIVQRQLGDKAEALMRGLLSVGMSEQSAQEAMAMAIICGVRLDALIASPNSINSLSALAMAVRFMDEYNGLPGKHFWMVPYGKEDKIQYAFVVSVDYLDFCAVSFGNSIGQQLRAEFRPVMDKDKARELLDYHAHEGWIDHPSNRVVLCRYVPYINGVRQIGIDEGWESASVGFYLHEGYRVQGERGSYNIKADNIYTTQRNPGMTPASIAQRRAQRAAARVVTRQYYRVPGKDEMRIDYINERLAQIERFGGKLISSTNTVYMADNDGENDVDIDPPINVTTATKPAEQNTTIGTGVISEKTQMYEEDKSAMRKNTGDEKSVSEENENLDKFVSDICEQLTEDIKEWIGYLHSFSSGVDASKKSVDSVRVWLTDLGKFSLGDTVQNGRARMTDVLIAIIFNTSIGGPIDQGCITAFLRTCGQKTKNAWAKDPNSEGAQYIQYIVNLIKGADSETF